MLEGFPHMALAAAPLRSLSEVPGPKGWPLLGNVAQLDLERLHAQLEDWAKAFGESFVFRIGPLPVLVLAGLEPSLTVLKERPQKFRRYARIEAVFEEMGGNGVFSAEGEAWQRQRKLVTKAMTPRQIEDAYPALHEITRRLLKRWETAARAGAPSDMNDDFTRYTVDTTTSLLFGRDLNTLETDGVVIQEHIHRILPAVNARINAPFPYWHFVRLPKDRALDRALAAVRAFVGALTADARRALASKSPHARKSLLEVMVELSDAPQSEFAESDLLANVVTLLLTGEDTTAYSLAWAAHILSLDPVLQDRLAEGVRAALGDVPLPARFEDAAALSMLEGFSLEAIRHRPVAPIISMEAIAETELDGIAVPAGTPILILTRPMGLDARHFPAPDMVKPERWEAGKKSDGVADGRAYLHFGAGPRLCPGRFLSLLEMKMALATLIANFRLSPVDPPEAVGEHFEFTMKPTRLRLSLEVRER